MTPYDVPLALKKEQNCHNYRQTSHNYFSAILFNGMPSSFAYVTVNFLFYHPTWEPECPLTLRFKEGEFRSAKAGVFLKKKSQLKIKSLNGAVKQFYFFLCKTNIIRRHEIEGLNEK